MAFFNSGAPPSLSSAVMHVGQPLPAFGRRTGMNQTTTVHVDPGIGRAPLTDNDGDHDGEDIFAQVPVTISRYAILPTLTPDSIPRIQIGSVAFVADSYQMRQMRGHSLPVMNALLFMMSRSTAVGDRRVRSLTDVLEHYRLGGVLTTEQSDRNALGRTNVAMSNTAGTSMSMCRFMWTGKWQDMVDVWSDTRSLFAHPDNPPWAKALYSSTTSELMDGVVLCVALVGVNSVFITTGEGAPFAASTAISAACSREGLTDPESPVVFQFVPIALRRGMCVSRGMFADPVAIDDDPDRWPDFVVAGYTTPAAVWKIGQVHMRNEADVATGTVRFPIPRTTVFPRDMTSAAGAMDLCERRDHIPVIVRCMTMT
jgi:hypothetical protein